MPLGVPRLTVRSLTALSRRFFIRLLVPTLALTVAVMAAVVYLVTSSSATALTNATGAHVEDLARAASARLDAWNQLVQAELSGYAAALEASSTPLSGTSAEMGRLFFARSSAFSEIALVNNQGQVVASSAGLGSGLSFAEQLAQPGRAGGDHHADPGALRAAGVVRGPAGHHREPHLHRDPGGGDRHRAVAGAGVPQRHQQHLVVDRAAGGGAGPPADLQLDHDRPVRRPDDPAGCADPARRHPGGGTRRSRAPARPGRSATGRGRRRPSPATPRTSRSDGRSSPASPPTSPSPRWPTSRPTRPSRCSAAPWCWSSSSWPSRCGSRARSGGWRRPRAASPPVTSRPGWARPGRRRWRPSPRAST